MSTPIAGFGIATPRSVQPDDRRVTIGARARPRRPWVTADTLVVQTISVYAKCMAVKTITIDLESYELLAARKRPGESFSRVIKRTLRDERYTASHLLEHLDEVLLAEDTVTAIEAVVKEREHDKPAPVDLEGEPCS